MDERVVQKLHLVTEMVVCTARMKMEFDNRGRNGTSKENIPRLTREQLEKATIIPCLTQILLFPFNQESEELADKMNLADDDMVSLKLSIST